MSNMRDAFGLRVPYGKASSQYATEFDPATRTIWGYFNPKGTPCFSLGLLKDIRNHDNALAADGGQVEVGGELQKAHYYVCGSRIPRVFNLGGDLALFVLLIKARDRDALAHYARLCIDTRIGTCFFHGYVEATSPYEECSRGYGAAVGLAWALAGCGPRTPVLEARSIGPSVPFEN